MSDEQNAISAPSRFDAAINSAKGFWQWWTEELHGLLPQSLRSQLTPQSKALLIELDSSFCHLSRVSAKGSEILNKFSLEQPPDSSHLEQRQALASMAGQTILSLPDHFILRKVISLPEVTENRLADVLRFEMDRHTPFKAGEVYFNYNLTGRDHSQQKINIELAIVTRSVLDDLLHKLKTQGLNPKVVVPEGTAISELNNPRSNLLPVQNGDSLSKAQQQRQQKFWILLILVVLVALAALYQRHQSVNSLTEKLIGPKTAALEAKNLEEQLEQLKRSRSFLLNRRQQSASDLILLSELTSLLPDNTWLTRLTINKESAVLQGESTNASELISLIEVSDHFKDVRFSSPVTINPRTQKESFSIMAHLEQGQGGAE